MTLSVDIHKQFDGFDLNVAFDAQNEVVGLLGASGSGKSLTLKSIAGLISLDSGKIVVDDVVFFDKAKSKKAKINLSPQQRKTALLFQNYMLFPNMTIEQNILSGVDKEIDKKAVVNEQLRRFKIEEQRYKYPSEISGGQQQRVALARMLAARPQILMLDEPLSAIDSHVRGILEQNLAKLFDDFSSSILYVSHDIDEALRLSKKIAVLDHGEVVEICDNNKLVNNPSTYASMKLSGCKNALQACYIDENHVLVDKWNVKLKVSKIVPKDVKFLGIRAFNITFSKKDEANTFKMRVEQSTDSRFDRSLIMSFCEKNNQDNDAPAHQFFDDSYLYWRIDKMKCTDKELPVVGDELFVKIPEDAIYLACK